MEIMQQKRLEYRGGKVTIEDNDGNGSLISCNYVVNAIGEEQNVKILKEMEGKILMYIS